MIRSTIYSITIIIFCTSLTTRWGFVAHKKINRLAIFTLPQEMLGFYKRNIEYITEHAIDADKRRHSLKGEAECHYIDIDEYGDSAFYKVPKYWIEAERKHSEDTLRARGIVPWHIMKVKYHLTEAFKRGNKKLILKLSADIGHYIADAHVPLHTTKNYNGQLTNQHGIHSLWEGRLPELFCEEYDFFIGNATYLNEPQLDAWKAVESAHTAVDSVFRFEKELSKRFRQDKKYSFEERNGNTVKIFSEEFSKSYHKLLKGQVERQMRASIKMIGDFWYTCWVDAGQPNLDSLGIAVLEREEKYSPQQLPVREHD